MSSFQLHHGDCLDVLRAMPDASVDSVVTDPPYGLSFMGKRWDYDVPSVEIWAECLRVLKPGGHLLAFAGTRTQHRMAVRIENAGFEIRDMIAWVYGCLSDDSEVLTREGWERYHTARHKEILAYDVQTDVYKWEKPSRWNEYRVESDTAYRIQSDHTDQIVSRGHRCIVERGGVLAFVPADELAGVERVPYLRDDLSALPQGRGELLFQAVLWEGEGLDQETCGEWHGQEVPGEGFAKGEKPGVEGRRYFLQAQGEVRAPVDQIRSMPCALDAYGAQGRVCDGAPACGGIGDWQATDADGVCASHQPRCDGQQTGKPDAVCEQRGSQTVRARASYQTTLATVTAIEYSGLIWCPTVSTGAFVARRNGKAFITGNSGFPKSLDVSKALDKAAGVLAHEGRNTRVDGGVGTASYRPTIDPRDYVKPEPVTNAARQWAGWGTALKPALEPITVARKPLAGTVADNVLRHGTGGLNIDGCRVGSEGGTAKGSKPQGAGKGIYGAGLHGACEITQLDAGRWPANFIHDGSEEAAEPLGSAARFFYCAKASKADRGADNAHPTVKPTDLMRYLCRLVTPPGGVVLDPFTGSGSTGKAAILEGFRFIGIEREAEYVEIARARIEAALKDTQSRLAL